MERFSTGLQVPWKVSHGRHEGVRLEEGEMSGSLVKKRWRKFRQRGLHRQKLRVMERSMYWGGVWE